jgi:hypothetical protein
MIFSFRQCNLIILHLFSMQLHLYLNKITVSTFKIAINGDLHSKLVEIRITVHNVTAYF